MTTSSSRPGPGGVRVDLQNPSTSSSSLLQNCSNKSNPIYHYSPSQTEAEWIHRKNKKLIEDILADTDDEIRLSLSRPRSKGSSPVEPSPEDDAVVAGGDEGNAHHTMGAVGVIRSRGGSGSSGATPTEAGAAYRTSSTKLPVPPETSSSSSSTPITGDGGSSSSSSPLFNVAVSLPVPDLNFEFYSSAIEPPPPSKPASSSTIQRGQEDALEAASRNNNESSTRTSSSHEDLAPAAASTPCFPSVFSNPILRTRLETAIKFGDVGEAGGGQGPPSRTAASNNSKEHLQGEIDLASTRCGSKESSTQEGASTRCASKESTSGTGEGQSRPQRIAVAAEWDNNVETRTSTGALLQLQNKMKPAGSGSFSNSVAEEVHDLRNEILDTIVNNKKKIEGQHEVEGEKRKIDLLSSPVAAAPPSTASSSCFYLSSSAAKWMQNSGSCYPEELADLGITGVTAAAEPPEVLVGAGRGGTDKAEATSALGGPGHAAAAVQMPPSSPGGGFIRKDSLDQEPRQRPVMPSPAVILASPPSRVVEQDQFFDFEEQRPRASHIRPPGGLPDQHECSSSTTGARSKIPFQFNKNQTTSEEDQDFGSPAKRKLNSAFDSPVKKGRPEPDARQPQEEQQQQVHPKQEQDTTPTRWRLLEPFPELPASRHLTPRLNAKITTSSQTTAQSLENNNQQEETQTKPHTASSTEQLSPRIRVGTSRASGSRGGLNTSRSHIFNNSHCHSQIINSSRLSQQNFLHNANASTMSAEARLEEDPALLELAHPKLLEKLEKSNALTARLQKDLEQMLERFLELEKDTETIENDRDRLQHRYNLQDHELEVVKRRLGSFRGKLERLQESAEYHEALLKLLYAASPPEVADMAAKQPQLPSPDHNASNGINLAATATGSPLCASPNDVRRNVAQSEAKKRAAFMIQCLHQRKVRLKWSSKFVIGSCKSSERGPLARDFVHLLQHKNGEQEGGDHYYDVYGDEEDERKIKVLSQELLKQKTENEKIRRSYNHVLDEVSKLKDQVQELKGNIRVFCRLLPYPGDIAVRPKGSPENLVGREMMEAGNPPDQEQATSSSSNIPGIATSSTRTSGPPSRSTSTRTNSTARVSSLILRSSENFGGREVEFSFDRIFTMNDRQQTVYEEVGPLLDAISRGFHLAIFAYGQTGSGKTYTLDGTAQEPGILRSAVQDLLLLLWFFKVIRFGTCEATRPEDSLILNLVHKDQYNVLLILLIIAENKTANSGSAPSSSGAGNPRDNSSSGTNSTTCKYTLVMSVVEIYNENVRDLLQSNTLEEENIWRIAAENNGGGDTSSMSAGMPLTRDITPISARGSDAGSFAPVSRVSPRKAQYQGVSPRKSSAGVSPRKPRGLVDYYGGGGSGAGVVASSSGSRDRTPTRGGGGGGSFPSTASRGGFVNLQNQIQANHNFSTNVANGNNNNNNNMNQSFQSQNSGPHGGTASASSSRRSSFHAGQNLEVRGCCESDSWNSTHQSEQARNFSSSLFGGIYVDGLTTKVISSWADAEAILNRAKQTRVTAGTALNDVSSRSHCIYSIGMLRTGGGGGKGKNAGAGGAGYVGALHVIDLAGSERTKISRAEGQRLTEAKQINKSLSALGDTLFALEAKQAHIPFRNSKLSYLLSDVLSQSWSKVLLFATVHPGSENVNESFSTLSFARRIGNIEKGRLRGRGD
ncbi:unnamed protein product [Amoebophrya sp. A25]|nr:unnamed protein product [Amoebophrya sp. A25]|eukprot:GSA25T00001617001.1